MTTRCRSCAGRRRTRSLAETIAQVHAYERMFPTIGTPCTASGISYITVGDGGDR